MAPRRPLRQFESTLQTHRHLCAFRSRPCDARDAVHSSLKEACTSFGASNIKTTPASGLLHGCVLPSSTVMGFPVAGFKHRSEALASVPCISNPSYGPAVGRSWALHPVGPSSSSMQEPETREVTMPLELRQPPAGPDNLCFESLC